jgi:hypothetical protein
LVFAFLGGSHAGLGSVKMVAFWLQAELSAANRRFKSCRPDSSAFLAWLRIATQHAGPSARRLPAAPRCGLSGPTPSVVQPISRFGVHSVLRELRRCGRLSKGPVPICRQDNQDRPTVALLLLEDVQKRRNRTDRFDRHAYSPPSPCRHPGSCAGTGRAILRII